MTAEPHNFARTSGVAPPSACAAIRAADGIARAAVAHYRRLVRRQHLRVFEADMLAAARAGLLRAIREGHRDAMPLFRGARHAVLAAIRAERRSSRGAPLASSAQDWDSEFQGAALVDYRTPERILIAREELRRVARGCVGPRRLPRSWMRAVEGAARGDALDAAGRVALTQARRALACNI